MVNEQGKLDSWGKDVNSSLLSRQLVLLSNSTVQYQLILGSMTIDDYILTAYEEQHNDQPFPSLNTFDTPQEASAAAVQIASQIPQPTGPEMAFPATSHAFMKIVGVPMAQSLFTTFKGDPPGNPAGSQRTIEGQAFFNTAAGQTFAAMTGGNPYSANISAVPSAQLEQFYYAVDIYFAMIWKSLVNQGQPLPNLSKYGIPVA